MEKYFNRPAQKHTAFIKNQISHYAAGVEPRWKHQNRPTIKKRMISVRKDDFKINQPRIRRLIIFSFIK